MAGLAGAAAGGNGGESGEGGAAGASGNAGEAGAAGDSGCTTITVGSFSPGAFGTTFGIISAPASFDLDGPQQASFVINLVASSNGTGNPTPGATVDLSDPIQRNPEDGTCCISVQSGKLFWAKSGKATLTSMGSPPTVESSGSLTEASRPSGAPSGGRHKHAKMGHQTPQDPPHGRLAAKIHDRQCSIAP